MLLVCLVRFTASVSSTQIPDSLRSMIIYCLTMINPLFPLGDSWVSRVSWQYWGLNSGPQTCQAGTQPFDLFSQPWCVGFHRKLSIKEETSCNVAAFVCIEKFFI
jgi:hypothetical protein